MIKNASLACLHLFTQADQAIVSSSKATASCYRSQIIWIPHFMIPLLQTTPQSQTQSKQCEVTDHTNVASIQNKYAYIQTFQLVFETLDIFDINFITGKMESFLLNGILQLCTAYNALHQLGWLCIHTEIFAFDRQLEWLSQTSSSDIIQECCATFNIK